MLNIYVTVSHICTEAYTFFQRTRHHTRKGNFTALPKLVKIRYLALHGYLQASFRSLLSKHSMCLDTFLYMFIA